MTEESRTTPLQLLLMVVFGFAYFALAAAIVVVLPAVAIVRAWESGFDSLAAVPDGGASASLGDGPRRDAR